MKHLPLILLFCLALSGCTPSVEDTTSSTEVSESTPESSTEEKDHTPIVISRGAASEVVSLYPSDYAWYSFTNKAENGTAFGFLAWNEKELIFEPFRNYVKDSSSEEALGPACTGKIDENRYYYYFDIYLDAGETFYIRLQPKNGDNVLVSLLCYDAETMESTCQDQDGNYYLKGLHCHTYGYYRAKDSQYHMNSCWKDDSTLSVEPHRFGEPKTVDSTEVVTCLDCGYTKQVSSAD